MIWQLGKHLSSQVIPHFVGGTRECLQQTCAATVITHPDRRQPEGDGPSLQARGEIGDLILTQIFAKQIERFIARET